MQQVTSYTDPMSRNISDGSFFYFVKHFAQGVDNFFSRHKLIPPAALPIFETFYYFREDTKKPWYEVFEVDSNLDYMPFPSYSPKSTIHFYEVINTLNLRLNHVTLLKNIIKLYPDNGDYLAGRNYKMMYSLDDIIKLNHDYVILVFTSAIFNDRNNLILDNHYYYGVDGLKKTDTGLIRRNNGFNRHDPKKFKKLLNLCASLKKRVTSHGEIVRVHIPKNFAEKFGKLIGDYNILYTNNLLSHIFHWKKPSIQKTCLSSLILKILLENHSGRMQQFSIHYCQPVSVNQTISIQFDNCGFFVHGIIEGKATLLAHGEYRIKSHA